jgi:hypothetical protein
VAIRARGKNVLQAFNIIKPLTVRTDTNYPIYRLIGVLARKDPSLPPNENLDGEIIGIVITALIKGSILSKQ